MTVSSTIATIFILLTPIVLSWSFLAFIILRICQGATFSILFTVAGVIVNEWATIHEKGLFIAVLSAHVEMGAVFTMPVSGVVATSAGWPCVFYLHGIILGCLTVLWAVYYRDRAVEHPFLKEKEWKKISNGKKFNLSGKKPVTPIRKIVSSIVIWGVWIAVIGNFLVSQFSISYAPIYLRGVIGCEPTEAGLLTLIPMACLLVIKFSTGSFSDRIKSISELNKMKIFNSFALLGSSIFFIILSVTSPGGSKVLDVALLSIPMALLGFSSGGYGKCAVMVAGQYSPFVMSVIQILACVSLMGGSFLVPALTPTDQFFEWQRVFVIYGAVLSFANTVFIVFARAEPAKWAQDKGDLMMIKAVMGEEKNVEEEVETNVEGSRVAPEIPPIVMTVSSTIATIFILLTPIVLSWSFLAFIILRICQGATFSILFTVAGVIVNEWATIHEKGLFIAVLSAHVEMGAVFTMPVSGVVATSAGWPCVFYLHGIILGCLTVLWAVYYRDRAVEHPFLKEKEWKKISNGKKFNLSGKKPVTPIRKIVSSIVIWGVWIAVIGNFLVSQFSISYAPIYLRGVIGCEPTEAGLLTLIPMACLLVIKFSTGSFSDRIKSISELNKMKIFKSFALLGSSIFFIILSVTSPGGSKVLDVALLSIPMALLGFSSGGYGKCAVMVAGQYSPFVMSVIQILACVSLMGGSFLVPALTPTDQFFEWQRVFVIYGAVLSFANTVFIVFARAEPAKWAQDKGDLMMIKAVMGEEKNEEEEVETNVEGSRVAPEIPPIVIVNK